MSLPALNRPLLSKPAFVRRADLAAPPPAMAEAPETIVQFGTGALLRGLIEPVLDAANRTGRYRGRVVMVGSTGSGRDGALAAQDFLYTLHTEGLVDGRQVEQTQIIGVLSRALSAATEWEAVLDVARSPSLEVVVSNTTEVGITLDEADDARANPPRSYPAKLAAFLYARATAFDFSPEHGLVVLPCELIEGNGAKLRSLVLLQAARAGFGADFDQWVRTACLFANTLVDRIVPGTPKGTRLAALEGMLGYRDALLTVCEPYRLLAIEGDDALRARLPWAAADPEGVVIAPDITPYRERKVRILNGTHSATVPMALLAGHRLVREMMTDAAGLAFVRQAMLEEIVPSLDVEGGAAFAAAVLDRFANPFLDHQLTDIILQQTSKLRVRVVPSIRRYYEKTGLVPDALARGFAAYLRLLRGERQPDGSYLGRRFDGTTFPLRDDHAATLAGYWATADLTHFEGLLAFVRGVVQDPDLWQGDLVRVQGFAETVARHLDTLLRDGAPALLKEAVA